MTDLLSRLTGSLAGRLVLALLTIVLVLGVVAAVDDDAEKRTLAAYFPRAVSVYEGTDVRVLGVNVGRVTAVLPEGDAVRVEIEYDAERKLPAGAKAAIVTPTLVADRFVQITPAYSSGPVLDDGAEIALQNTGVPVELDRIYAALRDLTVALGPNGVNRNGTLNRTLKAAAGALDGNGARGNQMLHDLSRAATTFAQGSGDLFATVGQLAKFTSTLAKNDRLVRAFIADLADVSESLVTEGDELQQALAAVGGAVGTVETFVRKNRKALATDVEKLTRVMKTINSERDNIDDALSVAPLALNNLLNGQDMKTRTQGSRIGLSQTIADLDGIMCAVLWQTAMPRLTQELLCGKPDGPDPDYEPETPGVLPLLLENLTPQLGGPGGNGAARQRRSDSTPASQGPPAQPGVGAAVQQTHKQLATLVDEVDNTLKGLLGGGS